MSSTKEFLYWIIVRSFWYHSNAYVLSMLWNDPFSFLYSNFYLWNYFSFWFIIVFIIMISCDYIVNFFVCPSINYNYNFIMHDICNNIYIYISFVSIWSMLYVIYKRIRGMIRTPDTVQRSLKESSAYVFSFFFYLCIYN